MILSCMWHVLCSMKVVSLNISEERGALVEGLIGTSWSMIFFAPKMMHSESILSHAFRFQPSQHTHTHTRSMKLAHFSLWQWKRLYFNSEKWTNVIRKNKKKNKKKLSEIRTWRKWNERERERLKNKNACGSENTNYNKQTNTSKWKTSK